MDLEGVDLLSEQECRWLLGQARVGRVAVSLGELPVMFPVNYAVAGDEFCFSPVKARNSAPPPPA